MTDLVSSDAWVDCGAYNVDFYLNDGSKTALDPLLFADRRTGPPNQFAALLTTDYNHVGIYDIAYTIYYEDYPGNKVDSPTFFTHEILLACPQATTFTPSNPDAQTYTLTDTQLSYVVPAFTTDPTICEVTYSMQIKDNSNNVVPCASCFDPAT